MITILTWISITCGGVLVLLLLLSILGGLDLDLDIGGGDIDVDGGGDLGIIKGILTFISVSSWVIKIILEFDENPVYAFTIGIIAGIIAVFLLNLMLRFLLNQQENVNWQEEDVLFKEAKVYLRIPAKTGYGLIKVHVNGIYRELKAVTQNGKEIPTGKLVVIEEIENGMAKVSLVKN